MSALNFCSIWQSIERTPETESQWPTNFFVRKFAWLAQVCCRLVQTVGLISGLFPPWKALNFSFAILELDQTSSRVTWSWTLNAIDFSPVISLQNMLQASWETCIGTFILRSCGLILTHKALSERGQHDGPGIQGPVAFESHSPSSADYS